MSYTFFSLSNITDHTRECLCQDCDNAKATFSYEQSHDADPILMAVALLLDTLDVNSCTVVGYRGNHWTIEDSRG